MASISVQITTAAKLRLNKNEALYTFFSLPDGESMLIRTGAQKSILINTGSKKSKNELFRQLKKYELEKIDILIITSNHEDACGNAKEIIEKYAVEKIITHTKDHCIENGKKKMEIWKSGNLYELSPGLLFKALKMENSESMSLFILFGNNSLLFMSEASDEMEELIKQFPARVEMLKIPEYGLKNYPSIELLEFLNPHLTIIYNFNEGNLHEGLMERLNESWIDVYHLKTIGTFHIHCTPGNYEIKK
jgi:competence protein ComEC